MLPDFFHIIFLSEIYHNIEPLFCVHSRNQTFLLAPRYWSLWQGDLSALLDVQSLLSLISCILMLFIPPLLAAPLLCYDLRARMV